MIDKQRYCSIVERFLAYKYRKENNILYSDDLTIPEQLVEDYFDLKKSYNLNDKEFIRKYVENELNFEEIDHCETQKKGMRSLYKFLVNEDIEQLNFYTLKLFHKKLFEYEKYSEYAGEFRKAPAYLKGDPTNLVAWENIYREALYLNKRISVMHEKAKKIKEEKETEEVLSFIYDTVNLSADMLLVHPFVDGNGRTVRALTNKLFIDAGIPPVYVTPKEKHEYIKEHRIFGSLTKYLSIISIISLVALNLKFLMDKDYKFIVNYGSIWLFFFFFTMLTGVCQKRDSAYFNRGLIAMFSLLFAMAVYAYAFRKVLF